MIFTGKVSGEKTVLTVGGRHTVKAQPGEQYGLIDEVTGLVPDGVEADRSGDDLILRKKEEDTEVRIEGFWEECQPGETQCTAVFNIVGEDGQVTEAVLTQDGPVLDDITAGQSGTLSDDDRGGFIWLGGLAFGGGLAAMALAAGGGGSKHRHENDDSDTTAPSSPALKAEDDGSVSVELPGDANKGDTVDVTFEDEKGGKHTVTLEKGDNGWTSSDPTLIPDSTGDKATIPADNVKDNSEVTGVAKDPSGNESDPSTVTSKTDGVADAPVLSIPEVTDGYANADELKDGLQAEVTLPAGTAEGAVITLTVTRPDKTTENVTHTVTKDEVAAGKVSMDIPKDAVIDGQNSVSVTLTQGSNPAKPGNVVDFAADTQIPGDTDGDGATDATPVVAIPEAADGVNAEELKDGVQTEVTVPKGSAAGDTLTLTVTKPDGTTDTVEHTLTADEVAAGKADVTITGTSDNVTAATDIVDNAGASATGVIYDGNAISLRNLDGDFTLKYSLSSSIAEKGDFGYTIGANSGENDPMVTTDYNDTVYVGYYQSGKETTSYSNVANSQDNGPDGTKTDGNQSITTVDLGAGDDLMVIRGNMLANTRVYTGEGNDTFTMDGMNTALRVMYAGSYIFTESGDDIVTIKRTGVTNAGQIYLGSGSDTFIQGDATDNNDTTLSGLLDLGSGTKDISNMPKEYLSVYQDGSNLSLGNDNNIDTATDVNTVTIYGSVSGEILGGYGSDNITVTKNLTGNISVGDNADTLTAGWIYGGSTVSMGDGNDTVTITDGAYNTTISLGAGDDVFDATSGVMGDSAYATVVNGEDGNDTFKLGTIAKNLTIDAGAGDDIVVLTKDYDSTSSGNQGYINGGEGSDTLVLTGTISVNLAAGKNEGIAGFEKVDMTVGSDLKADNAAQLVKLTASDVLGINDNSTIYISGDANDKVDLGADGAGSLGTFTATATTVKATALDGIEHTYTLYSSVSGANVYIDNNIIDANGVI